MLCALTLTLALSQPAAAAGPLSLDVVNSTISLSDPRWDTFSQRSSLGAWGLRGGYAVNSWLTGVVGWQYAEDGGWLWSDDSYDSDLRVALVTNQVSIGPKFSLNVLSFLQPYATVQAEAVLGRARLDDDPYHDDNLNQLRGGGVAFGGLAAGGVDLIARRVDKAVRPTLHVELGYAATTALELDALGALELRGFYSQWGVGARF